MADTRVRAESSAVEVPGPVKVNYGTGWHRGVIWLGMVGLAIALLILAGFLFLRGGEADGGAAATEVVAAEEPVVAKAPAPVGPELINTGDDWDAIVRSHMRYADWMFVENPDHDLLTNIWASTKIEGSYWQRLFTRMRDENLRFEPHETKILETKVSGRSDDGMVVITWTVTETPEIYLVDEAGNVVETHPARHNEVWLQTWGRDHTGRWVAIDLDIFEKPNYS